MNASLLLGPVSSGEQITLSVTVSGSSASLDGEQKTSSTRTELEGSITSLSGACPTLTFAINGTTVRTDASTHFDGTPCANLSNGDRADVDGTPQADGSVLEIQVEVNNVQQPQRVDLEGVIGGLSGTCPNLAFTLDGVTVKTDGSTRFDASPCANVANGQQAEADGTVQSDGSVLATRVEAKPGQPGAGTPTKLEGPVASLSGSCPNLTFTVNGIVVKTNSATQFDGTPCGGLANGAEADVEGVLQPDGSLLAAQVEAEASGSGNSGGGNGGGHQTKVQGPLSALAGSCPTLTFKVGTTSVATSGRTEFKDVTCSALANGVLVEVEGTLNNGVLAAASVEKK